MDNYNLVIRLMVSILFGFAVLWIMEPSISKYFFALTFALIFFVLFSLYDSRDKSFSFSVECSNLNSKLLVLAVWFLTILLVVFISPVEVPSQFVQWSGFSVLSWMRLVGSFLVTTVFPGYGLFVLLSLKKNFDFLEKLVFSVLLSIFLSSAAGFVGTLLENSVSSLSFVIILFANVSLLALTVYKTRADLLTKEKAQNRINIGLNDAKQGLLLLLLVLFVLLAVLFVNFPDKFVPTIDQWLHYGYTLRALNGTLFSFIPNFYWHYMYTGLAIYSSGFPAINAYMSLFTLCVLPILCFYVMCSKFWSKRNALVATTIYTCFSGLGGVYASYLRLTANSTVSWITGYAAAKTFDISAGAVSFSFYLFPKLIGFSALFLLIRLVYDRELPALSRAILVSLLFSLGYLVHVAEVYVFLLLVIFIRLFSRKLIPSLRSLSYGFFLSLVIIAVVDLVAPQEKYGFGSLLTGNFEFVAVALIGLVFFSFLLSFVKLDISSFLTSGIKTTKKLVLPFLIATLYVLSLCVIIWSFVHPEFSVNQAGEKFVWYFYPIKFGVPLFAAVFGAYLLFRSRLLKSLKVSLAIVVFTVLLERVFTFFVTVDLEQLAFFIPNRLSDFTWVGVALLATPFFVFLIKHMTKTSHPKKRFSSLTKFVAALLLVGLVFSSSASTFYNIQVRSSPPLTLTDNELDALDFLQNETPANFTIVALGYSVNKINAFGGRFPLLYYQPALFGATSFEGFVDILRHNTFELYGGCPLKYLWLTTYDSNELKQYENGYFVGHLLDYLPVVYHNDEVTIFEIPFFTPHSEQSDVAVVVEPLVSNSYQTILETLALSDVNYSIILPSKSAGLDNSVQILSTDSNVNVEASNLSVELQNGSSQKTLIVFNSLGTTTATDNLTISGTPVSEFFSIDISTTQNQTANSINGLSSVTFPSIQLPILSSNDAGVTPVAFYMNDDEQISPFAFSKKVGSTTAIYVVAYPYFSALRQSAGTEDGRDLFMTLSNIINVLDLNLPHCSSLTSKGRAILYGQTTLNGDVSITTTSFHIPGLASQSHLTLGWEKEVFTDGWSTSASSDNGEVSTMTADSFVVCFNASAKGVWQYFSLDVPNIDVLRFGYLIFREKVVSSSYNVGFVRVDIGGYSYVVRGWTDESSTGYDWKTFVFDLNSLDAVDEDAPVTPVGNVTKVSWTAYSTASSGTAELHLDYVVLADSFLLPNDSRITMNLLGVSEDSTILVDDVPTSEQIFDDVQIHGLSFSGDFTSTFKTAEALLAPPGLGVYSSITFTEAANLTISLNASSKVTFDSSLNGSPLNLTVVGGELNAKLAPLTDEFVVYVGESEVSANSSAIFENAFISWPYSIYNSGFPMEVTGLTSFTLHVMDFGYSLVSELKIDGSYDVLTQETVTWNEWNIPWIDVLTSPYHVLLVVVIFELTVMYILNKRKKFITKYIH